MSAWGLLVLSAGSGRISADQPVRAANASTTLGYVVSYFWHAMPLDAAELECPQGFAQPPKPSDYKDLEPFKSMDPAELQRISENQQERIKYMRFRGPTKADMCKQPWLEPNRTMPIGQNRRLNGIDLDGGKAIPGCAHGDMVSPDGRAGIDNQYSRVMTCIARRRPGGGMREFYTEAIRNGDYTLLIQLSGVDDLKQDDDIELLVTTSDDLMTKTADGKNVVQNLSFTPTFNPAYTTRFKGRIVDGFVLTDRQDMHVPAARIPNQAEVTYRNATLRLQIQADGTLKGVLGGYLKIADAFMRQDPSTEQVAGPFSCPAFYNALVSMADAEPDSQSGKCTSLSAGWEIEAVPAFLVSQK